jgi:hypothetical protein
LEFLLVAWQIPHLPSLPSLPLHRTLRCLQVAFAQQGDQTIDLDVAARIGGKIDSRQRGLIDVFLFSNLAVPSDKTLQIDGKREKDKLGWLEATHVGNDPRQISDQMQVVGMQLDDSQKDFTIPRFELSSRSIQNI